MTAAPQPTAGLIESTVQPPVQPAVDLRRLELTYPGPPAVEAIRGLGVKIESGEYVSIMGRSGSGKSSVLNVVGLLDRPTGGTYELFGVDVGNLPDRRLSRLRAVEIGFVFQAFHLLPGRTAYENVALPLLYRRVRSAARPDMVRDVLERVGIPHLSYQLPTRLSGGERQRVAIARAIVGAPRLLLCDEPTGSLDSDSAGQVMDVLDGLHADGLTIIIVTHDPTVAARAERTLRMADGRLVPALALTSTETP